MKRGGPLKRTPLQRGSSTLKRTRLSPVSAKQRQRVDDRRGTVAEALARDRQRCRLLDMLVGHRCAGPITPHHLRKQSAEHDDSAENIVALCAAGNTFVENEPLLAHRLGLVIRDGDL